jgi:hypothetical protein
MRGSRRGSRELGDAAEFMQRSAGQPHPDESGGSGIHATVKRNLALKAIKRRQVARLITLGEANALRKLVETHYQKPQNAGLPLKASARMHDGREIGIKHVGYGKALMIEFFRKRGGKTETIGRRL